MKKQRPRGVKGLAEVTQQVKGGPGAPALSSARSNAGAVSLAQAAHPLGDSIICPLFLSSFHCYPQGKQTCLFFPLCSQVAAKDKRKQGCLSCSSSSFLTSSAPSRSLGQLGHGEGPPRILAGRAGCAGYGFRACCGGRFKKLYKRGRLRSPTCFQSHLCLLAEKWCGDKFAFIFKNKQINKQP